MAGQEGQPRGGREDWMGWKCVVCPQPALTAPEGPRVLRQTYQGVSGPLAAYCLSTWGGGGCGPGQPRRTDPPTHIRKIFLRQKMKFIKGAGNLRPILGTNFFLAPDPSPVAMACPLELDSGLQATADPGLPRRNHVTSCS